MKKGWKIFWGVCAGMLGTGALLCVAASLMGADLESIGSVYPNGINLFSVKESMEDGSVPLASDMDKSYSGIRELDVDIFAGEVVLEQTDDINVRVRTENVSQRLGLTVQEKDGVLCIQSRKYLFGNLKGEIYIGIPKDLVLEEVELDIGRGVLECGTIRCRSLSVDASVGEVDISYIIAEEADLACDAGSIQAAGDVSDMCIDGGVGEVVYEAAGKEEDYNFDIDCGMGTVVCGDYEVSGIASEDSVDHGGSRELDIDCGVGSVTVTFDDGTRQSGEAAVYTEHPSEGHHMDGHHDEL